MSLSIGLAGDVTKYAWLGRDCYALRFVIMTLLALANVTAIPLERWLPGASGNRPERPAKLRGLDVDHSDWPAHGTSSLRILGSLPQFWKAGDFS
jgi:hypothetical protein